MRTHTCASCCMCGVHSLGGHEGGKEGEGVVGALAGKQG